MQITEHNVVEQIKAQNEEAISFIIDHYGSLLSAIVRRYISDSTQDQEECLDDVLLSIWDHIDSYDSTKNSFQNWIAAIAKFKAIDYQRKSITLKYRQQLVPEIHDSLMTSAPPAILEKIELDELFSALSANERKVFEKYYLEGTPTDEIARSFQSKPSWVHNILSRGRKKLRKWIVQNEK